MASVCHHATMPMAASARPRRRPLTISALLLLTIYVASAAPAEDGATRSQSVALAIDPHPKERRALQQRQCKDNPNYRSKMGMSCDKHETVNCAAFIHFRNFDQEDVDELLLNCPKACNSCPQVEQMVEEEATEETNDITQWQYECRDNPDYKSKMKMACDKHETVNCAAFINFQNFDQEDVDDLLRNCPKACKACPEVKDTEEGVTSVDEQVVSEEDETPKVAEEISEVEIIKPKQPEMVQPETDQSEAEEVMETVEMIEPTLPDQETDIPASKVLGTSSRGRGKAVEIHHPQGGAEQEEVLTEPSLDLFESMDDAACHSGWDPLCADDPSYVSKLGFRCDQHVNVDCTGFRRLGFTERQVYALVNKCPCSCRIPCGSYTLEPALMETDSPTALPSVSPTPRPSSSPVTESPTSKPSAAPVTDSPSSLPSPAPVTDTPTPAPVTPVPSPEPTKAASNSPSQAPSTLEPTNKPSPLPTTTESSEPSVAVSSEPSITASGHPSQSPTLDPTSAPSFAPSTVPTASPVTGPPTASPSEAPVTNPPSEAPITSEPSSSPITSPPSASPVTPVPSHAPVSPAPTGAPASPAPSKSPMSPAPTQPQIQQKNGLAFDTKSIAPLDNPRGQTKVQRAFSDYDGTGLNIAWEFEQSGLDASGGWSISDDGMSVKFNVEDSSVCVKGGNTKEQSGKANGIIMVFQETMPLYFSIGGMGEMLDEGYESLTLALNGVVIASATSKARGVPCSSGPAQVTYHERGPIYLPSGMHTISLQFTTFDDYDHQNVFYQLDLSRTAQRAQAYAPYMTPPKGTL